MSVVDAVSAVPERSLAQRMDALQRANEVRSFRAEVKRALKRRARAVTDVLSDPEPELATMGVLELLLAQPKVGRVKAMKILNRTRVSPHKTIGGLSERQRGELVALLRAWRV